MSANLDISSIIEKLAHEALEKISKKMQHQTSMKDDDSILEKVLVEKDQKISEQEELIQNLYMKLVETEMSLLAKDIGLSIKEPTKASVKATVKAPAKATPAKTPAKATPAKATPAKAPAKATPAKASAKMSKDASGKKEIPSMSKIIQSAKTKSGCGADDMVKQSSKESDFSSSENLKDLIFTALYEQCYTIMNNSEEDQTFFLDEFIHINQFNDSGLGDCVNKLAFHNKRENFVSIWYSKFNTSDGEMYGNALRKEVMEKLQHSLYEENKIFFVDRSYFVRGDEKKKNIPKTILSWKMIKSVGRVPVVDTSRFNFKHNKQHFITDSYNIPKWIVRDVRTSSMSKETEPADDKASSCAQTVPDRASAFTYYSDSDDTDDDTTADETTADETTADETTAEEITADETTAEDTTAEETTAEETTAEETTAEETTAEDTTADKPTWKDVVVKTPSSKE